MSAATSGKEEHDGTRPSLVSNIAGHSEGEEGEVRAVAEERPAVTEEATTSGRAEAVPLPMGGQWASYGGGAGSAISRDEWVVLNVGGQRFETQLSTLVKRDTMLARMFSDRNRCMLQRDSKGEYLIDRNGRAFEAILDYLRTGQMIVPSGITREQLLVECDFFSVDVPEVTLGPQQGKFLARSFRHAYYWQVPAQREFFGVKDEILRLVHAEAEQGVNYRIRFALLLANELSKCSGRLGDIVRQGKTIAPHPSQMGGWCLILKQFFTRYFIDQLQYCFESLGFHTSMSMFRYCSCDWCSKKARKTRYLTISWDEPQPDQEIADCLDRIQVLVETGIHVFPMEVK